MRIAVQAQLQRHGLQVLLARIEHDQRAGLHLPLDRAQRQPGHAQPRQDHLLDPGEKHRFVDDLDLAVLQQRRERLLVHDASQEAVGRKRQQAQRLAAPLVCKGAAVPGRRAQRHQDLCPTGRRKLRRDQPVQGVVPLLHARQQVGLAAQEQRHAIVAVLRAHAELDARAVLLAEQRVNKAGSRDMVRECWVASTRRARPFCSDCMRVAAAPSSRSSMRKPRIWRATGVRRSVGLRRSISSRPSHPSSCCMRREKAGCVTLRNAAARENVPASTRVRKSSIHSCFHRMAFRVRRPVMQKVCGAKNIALGKRGGPMPKMTSTVHPALSIPEPKMLHLAKFPRIKLRHFPTPARIHANLTRHLGGPNSTSSATTAPA